MSSPDLHGLFQVGVDILKTTIDGVTKKILAYTGSCVDETSDSDNVEWWQHVGFASRPPKPVPGDKKAAQAVVIRRGDFDIAIASQDLRGLSLYGGLLDGETCIYAPGDTGTGQARALFKASGDIHLYTRKGNTPDGTGMTIQIDAVEGAIRMLNDLGHAVIIDADGITLTAGAASLKLGADGSIKLVGTAQTQVDGASVVIGSIAVPVINSALKGPTGVAGVASLKVLIE